MGGSGAVRLLDVGVPRFFTRRRPVAVPEVVGPAPTPREEQEPRAEALLLVELDGWAQRLQADPTSARRMRARVRRMVRGAALRYAGEVEREEHGSVVCRFSWMRGAALAAAHVRSALGGDGGIPVRMVVHRAGRADAVAGAAVLRDLARAGDILLAGEVASRRGGHGVGDAAASLGTFLLAGVPGPIRVSVLETAVRDTPREAAVWGAPWMARLGRKGLAEGAGGGAGGLPEATLGRRG